MSKKQIFIDSVEVGYGTSVKMSPVTNLNSTVTFSGLRVANSGLTGFEIEIETIQSDSKEEFINLNNILNQMFDTKKNMTIIESITDTNGEQWSITNNFIGVLIDSEDIEYSPEDLSTRKLKFVAESRTQTIE